MPVDCRARDAWSDCCKSPPPPADWAGRLGHRHSHRDMRWTARAAGWDRPRLALIRMAPPVIIQIAIELKSVLTEHGKARRNRLRDFGAFHGHGHTYDPRTVVAAFLVINSSDSFYSPLNLGKVNRSELNTHASNRRNARQLVKESIDLFRTVHLRPSESDGPGLEALGVIVIEHDNINFHPNPSRYAHLRRPTQVAPMPPSLPVGDPLSYESMVQRICSHYTQRFGSR